MEQEDHKLKASVGHTSPCLKKHFLKMNLPLLILISLKGISVVSVEIERDRVVASRAGERSSQAGRLAEERPNALQRHEVRIRVGFFKSDFGI